jgi:hypothetical protein
MLRHSAQRSGLALTQVSPRELRHQPMQTTHIVDKFRQMHNKIIYFNYVVVNRVVADPTKAMDETDTNEAIVTATNHEHAGRLRTLQLSEVRDRWRPCPKPAPQRAARLPSRRACHKPGHAGTPGAPALGARGRTRYYTRLWLSAPAGWPGRQSGVAAWYHLSGPRPIATRSAAPAVAPCACSNL